MTVYVHTDIGRFAMTPEWLILAATPRALRVWCILAARWADRDTGECFPYRSTIGEAIGISEDTVDRALKELESLGALEIKPQFDAKGDQTANLYRLIYTGRTDAGTGPQICGDPPADLRGPSRTDAAAGEPESVTQNQTPSSLPLSETTTISDDSDNQETEGIPSDEGAAPLVEASTPDPLPPQVEEAYGMLVDIYGEEVARRALFIRDFEEQLTVPATWGAPRGRYASADVLVAAVRLAHVFADEAQEVGFRRPNPLLHATLRDLRIDLTADKATPEKLERLIRWAFSEESWWRDKLKTYADFHSKIDKLRVQANEAHRKMKSQAPAPQGGEDWMARTNY